MSETPGLEAPAIVADGPLWRVARHLSFYSIGSAISLLCSFAMLPVYATQFSAREFGVVATGQVAGLAAVTIARLGLTSGMFRFLAVYHAERNVAGANAAVTTSFGAAFATSFVATVAMVAVWFFLGQQYTPDTRLSGYLIAANVVISVPVDLAGFAFRAKQESRRYVVYTSVAIVLTTALTATLAIFFHLGAVAVFGSAVIANTVMGAAGLWLLREHFAAESWSWSELRQALRFGVPGVPALLADWVMQFSDRLFLTRFANLAQVGVYSLGYRFGLIEQQVLGQATAAAWDPFVLSEYRDADGATTIGRVASYFAMLGMGLAVFISAATPIMLVIIHARPEYRPAASVVFLIAFANLFASMQHMLAAPTVIRLKPELGTLIRGLGAVVNIALNFALIPTFGMLGAAWSTLATFVFIAVLSDVICHRLWPIAYEYRKLMLVAAGGVGVQLLVSLTQRSDSIAVMAVAPVWSTVAFAGWLLVTRAFSPDEARALARRLRSPWRRDTPAALAGESPR